MNHAVKINTLEHEVRMLKIRTAWTEKDLMYSQIEAAKRTLVVRNFPEWATAADRELTVAEALKENNLGYLEWDLTTTNMEGSDGKKFLAPISILTVQTYGARKKVMDACSRAVVRYWHEVKDEAGHEKEDETEDTEKKTTKEERTEGEKSAGSQDPKDDDMGEGSKTETSQKVWEIKTWNWNLPVKMAPGITQFERRLGAPLHGLMNAYQKLFTRFKKESLVPRWKTLILEDKEVRREPGWEESFTAARPPVSQERREQWRTGSARFSCRRSTKTASWSAGATSVRPAEAAALTDGSREGGLFVRLTEDQPGLCGRRPPEPLPHKGGSHLQRGRGARHRELGGTL